MEGSLEPEASLVLRQNEVINWVQLPNPGGRGSKRSSPVHLCPRGPGNQGLHGGLPLKLERSGTQQKTGVENPLVVNQDQDILDILGLSKHQTSVALTPWHCRQHPQLECKSGQTLHITREPSLDDGQTTLNPKRNAEGGLSGNGSAPKCENVQLPHSNDLPNAMACLEKPASTLTHFSTGHTTNPKSRSSLPPSAEICLKGESSGSTLLVEAESSSILPGKLLQYRKQQPREGTLCCCSRDIVTSPPNCQCHIV